MTEVWEKRLRRAEFLQKEWPFAAEILAFYRWLAELQQFVFKEDFAEPAHLESFLEKLRSELEHRRDPAEMARKARERAGWNRQQREDLLRMAWDGVPIEDPFDRFLAESALQPWALRREPRQGPREDSPETLPGRCPACGVVPLVGLLREDKAAETVRRTLICALCSHEWEFPRVLCPRCREEKPEKLPRFTAQEIPWIRVEACDSCGGYLKSIDLTLNPDADPIVDELGSTPLDAIATERGYIKLTRNLLGL